MSNGNDHDSNSSSSGIPPPPSTEVGYRDYSLLPPERVVADQGNAATQTFPHKLHYLLTYADQIDQSLNQIISWRPHGRCFMVHDPKNFTSQILPNWFMQNKLASFQRQLNLYSFKRFTTGPDKGGYYHELCLRDRPDLVLHIKRTKLKGEGHRKPASPELEPDFYREYPLLEHKQANGAATSLISSTSSLLVPALSMNVPFVAPPLPPLHHTNHQESSQPPLLQQFNSQSTQHEAAEMPSLRSSVESTLPSSSVSTLSQQDEPEAVVPFQQLGAIATATIPFIPPCSSPMLPQDNDASISEQPNSTRPADQAPGEAPQKELDRSMLMLVQQQELFNQDASSSLSPQSLASNLLFHNNDMIMAALQAAAPFYQKEG